MGVWYLALALSGALAAIAIVFFWRNKGTEGSATLKLPFGISLEKANQALMVFVVGTGGMAYSVVQLANPPLVPKVLVGSVGRIDGVPSAPTDSGAEQLGTWLDNFARDAVILVDVGEDDGVFVGDYFATVLDDGLARSLPRRDIGKVNSVATSLLSVDESFPKRSLARLKSFPREAILRQMTERFAGSPPTQIGSDAPVVQGMTVAHIPGDEKLRLDEIEEEEAEANASQDPERRRSAYEKVVLRIDRFLQVEGNASYFSPDALYIKGKALFALGNHRGAVNTLKVFNSRFKRHQASADALDLVKQSQEALRDGEIALPPTSAPPPTPAPPGPAAPTPEKVDPVERPQPEDAAGTQKSDPTGGTSPKPPDPHTPTGDELAAALLRQVDLNEKWSELGPSEPESVRGCGTTLKTQPATQSGVAFSVGLEMFLANQNYGYGGGTAAAALDELKESYRECTTYLEAVRHGNAPARVEVKQVVPEADSLSLYLSYSDPDTGEVVLEAYESWMVVNHSIARVLYYSTTIPVNTDDVALVTELLSTVAGRLRAVPVA